MPESTELRRPSAPVWRLLKILTEAGAEGVDMAVLEQRMNLGNKQIRNMIYRLQNHEGIVINSKRRARKDATYFVEGACGYAPTHGTTKILAKLKESQPLGVELSELRSLMASASFRRAIRLLNAAGSIVCKRSWHVGMRYWLTAEDRDAQLATEATPAKPERKPAAKPAPPKPKPHQKLTIGPRMKAIPPRTKPEGEVSYLTNYRHTKAVTPRPRFEPTNAMPVINSAECRPWAAAYGGGV